MSTRRNAKYRCEHVTMTDTTTRNPETHPPGGSAGEVFVAFLKLGPTSFGGPIAHLGYFRDELVVRRKWIDEEGYADLVAQWRQAGREILVRLRLGQNALLPITGPTRAACAWPSRQSTWRGR